MSTTLITLIIISILLGSATAVILWILNSLPGMDGIDEKPLKSPTKAVEP